MTIPYFEANTNAGVLVGETQAAPNTEAATRNAATFAIGAAVLAVCVLALLIGLGFLLWPLISSMRQSGQLAAGRKNLEKIVAAMRAYEAKHGSLPPACTYGPDGKPAHSWRTLILPYLGRDDLYQQYRFDRPWDDPANSYVAQHMPSEFAAPGDTNAIDSDETSYMVIVGPKTAFPKKGVRTIQSIRDPHGDTLLVVEIRSNGTIWTEPTDLDATTMNFAPNSGKASCPGTRRTEFFQAGMVDGKARDIPLDVNGEDVEAMSTINGGETLTQ